MDTARASARAGRVDTQRTPIAACSGLRARHPGQNNVHHIGDELAGHRQVAEQQAMLGRAEEQIEHHIPVHRSGDLAARDGPVQHDPVLLAQRLEYPVPPGPAQFRVVLRLGDQPGQHRPHRRLGDRPHPRVQGREQVAAQRAGVGQRLFLAERVDEGVQREQALGRPAPVDRRLADPGAGGHLFDRHRGQPPFGQQFHGRGQDGAVRLLAPRPPARRGTSAARGTRTAPARGTGAACGTPARRTGTTRHTPRNFTTHRQVLSYRYPKRSVTYLIGIMPVAPPSNHHEPTTATPTTATPTPAPPRRQPLQLALILVTAFMVVLDFSIVNVALPAIERELHMPADAVQWIVTGYAISFGGLLILGGRAADLLGRRRMFVIGLVVFAIASLAGGLAQDPVLLIAARVVQGAGAAIVAPAALSLITTGFPEGAERTRAIGLYGAVSSVGFVSGQVLGGVLVQFTSWRAVFLVNVPVGLIAAALSPAVLGRAAAAKNKIRLDVRGALLITGAVTLVVFAVSQGVVLGRTSPLVIAAVVVAAAAAAVFTRAETRHP